MRHIHVHLHSHGTSASPAADAPLSTKAPSTTPKRPPSTVIKPSPQSPHNPPRPKAPIKPMKPAGVIKAQQGTAHAPSAPKVGAGVKAVRGVTKLVNVANKIAAEG